MVYMVIKVERQLKKKGTTRYTSASSNPWKLEWRSNKRQNEPIEIEPPKAREDFSSKNKSKVKSQPQKNQDIKCFKLLGSRHIASQCPNKRVIVMQDSTEVVNESKSDGGEISKLIDASDDDEVEYPVKGKSPIARRALSTQISVNDME